jgi:hypothetical protein
MFVFTLSYHSSPVESIGHHCFNQCSSLPSVTIPLLSYLLDIIVLINVRHYPQLPFRFCRIYWASLLLLVFVITLTYHSSFCHIYWILLFWSMFVITLSYPSSFCHIYWILLFWSMFVITLSYHSTFSHFTWRLCLLTNAHHYHHLPVRLLSQYWRWLL